MFGFASPTDVQATSFEQLKKGYLLLAEETFVFFFPVITGKNSPNSPTSIPSGSFPTHFLQTPQLETDQNQQSNF